MVADDTAFVPDVYPDAELLDDCPSPEIVNVSTDADGDEEAVRVAELPGADVDGLEPEPDETGIVSTVGEPDGTVTVMTVAELGYPPVGSILDELPPGFDEAPPYVFAGVVTLDCPEPVPDDEDPAVPDEEPLAVAEPPGVYVTTKGDAEGFAGVTVIVKGLGPPNDCVSDPDADDAPLEDPPVMLFVTVPDWSPDPVPDWPEPPVGGVADADE